MFGHDLNCVVHGVDLLCFLFPICLFDEQNMWMSGLDVVRQQTWIWHRHIIAMAIEIVSFPMKDRGSFQSHVNVYRRANDERVVAYTDGCHGLTADFEPRPNGLAQKLDIATSQWFIWLKLPWDGVDCIFRYPPTMSYGWVHSSSTKLYILYPVVINQLAMDNGPFISDFPS